MSYAWRTSPLPERPDKTPGETAEFKELRRLVWFTMTGGDPQELRDFVKNNEEFVDENGEYFCIDVCPALAKEIPDPDAPKVRKGIKAVDEILHCGCRVKPEKGARRLRLNVKRRRTQRHGRSRKHRKLRKLTSRRR